MQQVCRTSPWGVASGTYGRARARTDRLHVPAARGGSRQWSGWRSRDRPVLVVAFARHPDGGDRCLVETHAAPSDLSQRAHARRLEDPEPTIPECARDEVDGAGLHPEPGPPGTGSCQAATGRVWHSGTVAVRAHGIAITKRKPCAIEVLAQLAVCKHSGTRRR